MKNILMFLFLSSCVIFTSCQKEDEFDQVEIDVIKEEPNEVDPRIKFKAFDVDGNPLSDTKLTLFNDGSKTFEQYTDANGELEVTFPSGVSSERALLIGEKEVYYDNIKRIEPAQLEAGIVEIILSPEINNSSGFGGSSNVYPLLANDVVLVNGQVLDTDGNPGKGVVLIFEEEVVSNGDTSLFQNFTQLDAQGNYEMLVPADIPLLISIIEFNVCGNPDYYTINEEDVDFGDGFYGENIGPFSDDTSLPTNTNANSGNITGFDVDAIGTVVDCNGSPMANAKILFGFFSYAGAEAIDSVWSDNNGQFNTPVNVCAGIVFLDAIVIVPGLPPLGFSTVYSEQNPVANFGTLENCALNIFEIKDYNGGTLTNNEIEIESYEPDVSFSVKESVGASEKFVLTGEMNTDGIWQGTEFEYYENGVLLYQNNQDFIFFLKDNGVTIELLIIGIEVSVLAGPDAGTDKALYTGSLIVYQ